eukprot:scaffold137_cov398-Prasinococcus_capsulatus_cf.AAC.55
MSPFSLVNELSQVQSAYSGSELSGLGRRPSWRSARSNPAPGLLCTYLGSAPPPPRHPRGLAVELVAITTSVWSDFLAGWALAGASSLGRPKLSAAAAAAAALLVACGEKRSPDGRR